MILSDFVISPFFVGVLIAISTIFLALAIAAFRASGQWYIPQETFAREGFEGFYEEEVRESSPFAAQLHTLFKRILHILGRIGPKRNLEKLAQSLVEAGEPGGWTPIDYLGFRTLMAGVFASLALLFYLGEPFTHRLSAFMLGGLLGYLLPSLWLRRRIKKRQLEIQRALPDAIDMLTICVEAGLSFEAAMLRVSSQWDNELTREFRRTVSEIRLGAPRAVALERMAQRSGVQELRSFVAILNQSVQLGVSISNVLRGQAEEMREQRRQRAQELAHQATVKIIFPLVFLIFPALFIVILGPAITIFAELFSSMSP
ncbi:MAG TPA: type II secretion system F family protein [Anaerolineae bacterium]|nr:type II secretion system F family protein [Caldilineae bacterium]HID35742.1 type II secretion system F family protein [Anaerolineae bacterium]